MSEGGGSGAPGHAHDEGRFNLSAWTLRHQALVIFAVVLLTLFGILAYFKLAQSEDPPFTFKVMVVRTYWPGADAKQVREQVTDRIARKLQEVAKVDYLRSYSRPGESLLFFAVKDSAPAAEVPATWYQVRKKVADIAHTLPPGIQGPFFNDEFGDVYTHIYTLAGDGFDAAQRHDYAERLRAELLQVAGVAKVDYFGDPAQRIFIDIDNARLSRLGISPRQIAEAINAQNAIAPTGLITTPDDRLFVRPSGQLDNVDALRETLLRIGDRSLRLGDIATIRRGYEEPLSSEVRFGGAAVLGIGITMQPQTNVIEVGDALSRRVGELKAELPLGLELTEVSSMPKAVSRSIDEFLRSVAEAVAIVLIVSLLSLGLRTGMVVVISIPVVLAITALFMHSFDIGLHKVSLGTLVLALGLLVDDAIIAVEMMAVKLEQGWSRSKAAAFAYTSTAFPMLTGTLVTVAGFLPIALAKSGTGEYTRSIFQVSAIALLVSWLAAVVLVPLLGYRLLPERAAAAQGTEHDLYNSKFYQRLSRWVGWCIERRWLVLALTGILFVIAMFGFGKVPQQFFPSSDRPELLVDLRLGEGASLEATRREALRLEALLKDRPEVEHVVGYVGSGAPRFYLPLDQKLQTPNFAQYVVTTHSTEEREALAHWLDGQLAEQIPEARSRLSRLENGPPIGFPVQFRVSGDDIGTVAELASKVADLVQANAGARNVQLDWDEPGQRSIGFVVDQQRARELGVSSQDIASFLAMTLSGYPVSQFRERDQLISIELRASDVQRSDPAALASLAMPTPRGPVPLTTLGRIEYGLEYGVIWERNRQPTITVQADVASGAQGIDVTRSVDAELADLRASLPTGYHVTIGGAVEESAKGQSSIGVQLPIMLVVVLSLLMIQLQSFSRVLLVLLTAPLGLIGVVAALLLFGQPFGFVALLGVIAMFGIIMRNSVILVDQIEQDIAAGYSRVAAIIGATTRRFRPIVLTAAAAVLALIPLLRSQFFGPMATALMGGITVATVLTLFFLPALYAAWFRVRADESAT